MLDISYAIIFYLIFSICGVFGFYFLNKVLPKANKSLIYVIAKPLGLLVIAYPIWLLSSFKLLKFNQSITVQFLFFTILIGFIGLLIWGYKKQLESNKIDWKVARKTLISIGLIEIGTIILYSLYLLVRAFKPDIEGTEKFMDLMMLSSAGKTEYFPFFDAWWAGKDVNYYYYGFYLFAFISNIGAIPYAVAYNLALGIIFAQTFVTCFAIIFRVTKNYISSFFGAALVNLSGNLHYANCVANNFDETLKTNCFYPKASRILDPAYTINEFPTYSYILGDLHPHVLSLPFFVLGLYLIVQIFKEKKFNIFLHLLFGFVIASTGLINFWDFMTLGGIYGIIVIYKILKDLISNRQKVAKYWKESGQSFFKSLIPSAIQLGIAALIATLPFTLFLPFFLHFKSPVAGVGFIPEFVSYHQKTYPNMQWPSSTWFQFGMWAFFVLLIIPSLLAFFTLNYKKWIKTILGLILFFSAILLIVFTELFYFRDLFHIANPPYFRANTVFKFTYHSWILLGISSAIFLHLAWEAIGKIKKPSIGLAVDISFLSLISVIFTLAFMYSHFGFSQAYYLESENIKNVLENNRLTLDGSKWIETRDPQDAAVIDWLNANQKQRVVILEAVGGAYTYNGRIGVYTGMGNIIQWETHQWTWRFHYPDNVKDWKEVTEKRSDTGYSDIAITSAEVKMIYETENPEVALSGLQKYRVKYVYIGNQERSTYTGLNEAKFEEIGDVVFQSGESKLYRINN